MKKKFGILLSVIMLLLVLIVAVACDPEEQAPTAQKYEISFESNGGDEVDSIVAEAGSDISALLPSDPTKKDLFFAGWSLENNGFSSKVAELPKTMPSENVTYFARWARHAVVVPKLQPLGEDGEPDANKENYVISAENSITVEVDPQSPALDLYDNRPKVTGFQDVSAPEEHEATIDVKEKTVYLYYNRMRYDVSFNLNNTSMSGNIQGARLYFGQKLELPDIPFNIVVPDDLRFAGWSSDYDGDKDFAAAGEEVEIGDLNSVIDGSTTSVTLYAVYDEGYVDFSRGSDYVFVPEHEDGVVYLRRAGLFEFEGEYYKNTALSETAPHIGEFTVENGSGTVLNGYVYDDGHFAYEQNFSEEFAFLKGLDIPRYSQEDDAPVEGSFLKFVDLYGCASLTLSEPIKKEVILYTETSSALGEYTFDAGTHMGGYWYDSALQDFCFSVSAKINGIKTQVDMHFQFVQTEEDADTNYFAFRGEEAGLFCEGLSSSGSLMGDLVVFDGYGGAIAVVGNSQYQGYYTQVSEDAYLTSMFDASDNYMSMLIRPDFDTLYGENDLNLLVLPYTKGDSSLFAMCENEDGSTFYSDGFGNAVYTTKDGAEISGDAALGCDMFEDTTPSIVYKLTDDDNKTHFFIVDQGEANGNFIHTESAVDVKYLYNTSASSGEYVGAIVTAGSDAYFLTAATGAMGNVVFGDLKKGTVKASDSGFLFESEEYVISYAEDEALTERYEIPTASTSQLKLSALTFSVTGGAGGTLSVTAGENGKATYTATEGEFEGLDYEFAYSSVIVKNGDVTTMFVVDSFGTSLKAFATVEKNLYVADSEEIAGKLYEYKDGNNDRATLWMNMYGEIHFYAFANISQTTSAPVLPISGENVYIIETSLSSYYAIKDEKGDYLSPNSLLRSGEFTLAEGEDKLQLDAYGFAKYTLDKQTYDGVYGIADGVYSVTFKATDSPAAFKFVLSGNTFKKVDYSEFYVVNPATLAVVYVMRIHGATDDDILDKEAELFMASTDSDGNVSMGTTPLGTSDITNGSDGVYSFNDTEKNISFTFRFDENIFTQKVLVRNNATLPKDKFTEEGANEDVSKWVQLDEYGGATYFDGDATHDGYYYNEGGLFRFVDPNDEDLVLRFTLDRAAKLLLIYGAKAKPFEGGTFDIAYDQAEYKLEISLTQSKELTATLKSGETVVATDKLEADEDNIYTFSAQDASAHDYTFKFIVSSGKLIQYDVDLDYEMQILTGNYYLLQEGRSSIDNNPTYVQAGLLTVKGFNEIAEIFDGEDIIKGSVKSENGNLIFTDEYGNTQTFKEITYGNENTSALFIYGSEMGAAVNCYMTMGAVSTVPTIYFDGLGKAHNVDPSSGEPTTEIGYYIFGANPYDREDQYQYIIVLKANGADATYDIADVYTPYSLQTTDEDGVPVNLTGIVKYDETHDAIAVADDGAVFAFNGFDEVEFIDSLGVSHSGYFNNYGEIMSEDGTPDNRYVITDEYDNVTLYYVYFGDSALVTARRAIYTVYTHHDDVDAEVQMLYSDEEGYEETLAALGLTADADKDGVAFLSVLIGNQQLTYVGFFTIDGGVMEIDALIDNGSTKEITLELNVDGTADWSNHLDWLE